MTTNNKLLLKDDLENFMSAYTATAKQTFPVLDSNGLVPLSKLPPECNAMLTVENYGDLPVTGNYDGRNVFVRYAHDDPTVTSGWAIYKYASYIDKWIKIAEGESLDLILEWNNIVHKPDNFLYVPDIINRLNYTGEGKVLDARQGKALKDSIDTINTALELETNLTSNERTAIMEAVFANV